MNDNGRIIQPNAMNIETTYAPGPLAQPSATSIQTAGGLKLLMIGGLTKVETLAGQIAAGVVYPGVLSIANMYDKPESEWTTPSGADSEFEHRVAVRSVNIAEAILAECQRRRTKQREDQSE